MRKLWRREVLAAVWTVVWEQSVFRFGQRGRKERYWVGGVAGRLSDWALRGGEVSGVIPSPSWTLSDTHLSLPVEYLKVFTN